LGSYSALHSRYFLPEGLTNVKGFVHAKNELHSGQAAASQNSGFACH